MSSPKKLMGKTSLGAVFYPVNDFAQKFLLLKRLMWAIIQTILLQIVLGIAKIMILTIDSADSRTALRDETRKLLLHRPYSLHLAAIAKAVSVTDHEVTEAWLKKFGQGKIKNPGVLTICALNEYLKNYKTSV